MDLFTEKKQTHGHGEQIRGCHGGGNDIHGEFRISRCKLFHLERISNEVLLYCTGNYIQSLVMEDNVRKRMYIYL